MLINKGIYSITNKINGKRYIGSARNIRTRWNNHKSCLRQQVQSKHHSPHLQRAWNKYGEENFVFEIICQVWDENKLLKVEQIFLDIYQVYNPQFGYNTARYAAAPMKDRKHSEESKKKISANNKGKGLSGRAGELHPMFGKHQSEETNLKRSKSLMEHEVTLETRKKLSEKNKGYQHSEQTRKKMSESHKGKHLPEEVKIKISNAHMGKLISEDTKQKLRNANLGKYLTEETKERISDALKGEKNPMYGKHHTEETKEKLREKRALQIITKETREKIGKASAGDRCYCAKLTWEKVREIRERYIAGNYSQRQLAAIYEVSRGAIRKIVRNKSWKEEL